MGGLSFPLKELGDRGGAPVDRPVIDLNFSGSAIPDHDYSDGLAHLGLQLAFNSGTYGGAGTPIAAIQDNGFGTQILRLKPNSAGSRYDDTGQTSGIFKFIQAFATLRPAANISCEILIDFDPQGSDSFGVVANDEALFLGLADDASGAPGTEATPSGANYAWFGKTVAVNSREINTMTGGTRTNRFTAGSFGGVDNAAVGHRIYPFAGRETYIDLYPPTPPFFILSQVALGGSRNIFSSGSGNSVFGYFGVHDINGTQPVFDIARIRVFLNPGILT